ncbi:MAG: hypothetical protein R3332_01675 [Pseudohongiellaceae bacterium]|nr:hypothetical protein [Pseudohongiellaceae bacterium]
MSTLKSNFLKLGFVLMMVVVLLVTLSLSLAASYDKAIAEKTSNSSSMQNASNTKFDGGPIPFS